MHYHWYDLAGLIGVATILVTYLLLQIGKLRSEGMVYSVLNAAGAGLIVLSLLFDFNLSAFLVEAFWVLISLVGIARALLKGNHGPRPEHSA